MDISFLSSSLFIRESPERRQLEEHKNRGRQTGAGPRGEGSCRPPPLGLCVCAHTHPCTRVLAAVAVPGPVAPCRKEASTATGITTGEMLLMWRETGLRPPSCHGKCSTEKVGRREEARKAAPAAPRERRPLAAVGGEGAVLCLCLGTPAARRRARAPLHDPSVPAAGAAPPAPCCSGPAARRCVADTRPLVQLPPAAQPQRLSAK